MDEEGYGELYCQIDDLKRQNHISRLEHELGSFRKELGEISGYFSTPAPNKEGQALGSERVWTDIPKGRPDGARAAEVELSEVKSLGSGKHDYDDLVKALEEHFAPPNQTELYRVQLRERRQKASESMAELGQDIRRLTNLAYPKAPSDVRETLAKEQFVDSLVNTEMRLKIKQARPVDLIDTVRHAVELEAFYRAENRQAGQGFINTAASSESPVDKKLSEAFSSLNSKLE